MEIRIFYSDILVVGAGLGGILATEEICSKNKDVIIATSGHYCSGASFYEGTWGLGMVGPKDEFDLQNFVDSIDMVGSNIPDKVLVKRLLMSIDKVIEKLENMGVCLKHPIEGQDVFPCFDNTPRRWLGFHHESARNAFKTILDNDNAHLLEYVYLIKIITYENSFKGALFIDRDGEYFIVKSKALILATGGFTNIYKYNVASIEMAINAHIPALEAGCKLINMEFIQFIPSHLKPDRYYKTIFNERVFNYIDLTDGDGNDLIDKYFPGYIEVKESLKRERSTYGPFTSRLPSRILDISMFKEYRDNEIGGCFKYSSNIYDVDDTLIQNYFKWFNSNGDIKETVQIIPFAHACNGGISINENGETSVKGVYAAGEVTGGMHGADRIGGLSALNAGVFGIISAINAIKYIEKMDSDLDRYNLDDDIVKFINGKKDKDKTLTPEWIVYRIRELMFRIGTIIRNEEELQIAIKEIKRIRDNYNLFNYLEDLSLRKEAYQAENYIKLADVLLNSMSNRRESRGSHFREDYPQRRDEYEYSQFVKYTDDEIKYYFK